MVISHRIRSIAVAASLAFAAATLTGCVTSRSCVDWVQYATPQDAFDDAAAVVVASSEPTATTVEVYGSQLPVYDLSISEVLKGDVDLGPLQVASTQFTCNGEGDEYPNGHDPLDVGGSLIIFLYRADDGRWRTITPTDGVLPLPADGSLPFETTP